MSEESKGGAAGPDLDAQLKALRTELSAQRKRADRAEALLRKAEASAAAFVAPATPVGDHVVLGGVTYPVVGSFRADNTFVEVKRGHCDEGITLVAINRAF